MTTTSIDCLLLCLDGASLTQFLFLYWINGGMATLGDCNAKSCNLSSVFVPFLYLALETQAMKKDTMEHDFHAAFLGESLTALRFATKTLMVRALGCECWLSSRQQ